MKSHRNALWLWLRSKRRRTYLNTASRVKQLRSGYTVVLTVKASPDEDPMSLQYMVPDRPRAREMAGRQASVIQ